MRPRLRRLVLATHIAVSVAWIGALAAYIPFDVVATVGQDGEELRAAYAGMDLIVSSVIIPLALCSLLTGLVISLGTQWGLFRHFWVVISLALTVLATVVLLVEARTIEHFAAVASDPATSLKEVRVLGGTLVHSIGGMGVLLTVLVLNVYKPKGMTRYGWRKQVKRREERLAVP